jgi:hypothetical protein
MDLPKKSSAKRPRPYVVDQEILAAYCQVGATQEEVCAILDIDEETLQGACKRQFGCAFPEFFKKHFNKTKLSLRRKQVQLALEGHPSMLIWLGKSFLNQSERHEVLQKGVLAIGSIDKNELITLVTQAKDFKKKAISNKNDDEK